MGSTPRRVLALVLGALALAQAAAALRYPLGSDPSLFQYHAWAMTEGVMPYRDSMEFNSPGVILLHLAVTSLLGFSDAAFIAFTLGVTALAALLGLRWLAPRVSADALLVAGAVALLAASSITPWDRGQRELFQGALLGGAFLLASRGHSFGAGVAAGFATLIKWPLVALLWPLWVLWLFLGARRGRSSAGGTPLRRAAASFLGFALPLVVTAAWLHGNDALLPFLAIQRLVLPGHLGAMNAPVSELLLGRWPLAMAAVAGLAILAANRRSESERAEGTAGAALLLGVTALLVLVLYLVQRKGWSYQLHTGVVFLAPLCGLLFERLVPARVAGRAALAVAALVAAQVTTTTIYDHGTGLERAHRVGGHWDHDAMVAVASLLQKGAASDRVQTNDDELQLLLLARRRAASPFVYGFLSSEAHPDPALRRLALERVDAIHRSPPEWVVWNTRPFRPELDALEANPTFASLLRTTCRELADAPHPYRVFRCKGSVPSLDGPRLLEKEL